MAGPVLWFVQLLITTSHFTINVYIISHLENWQQSIHGNKSLIVEGGECMLRSGKHSKQLCDSSDLSEVLTSCVEQHIVQRMEWTRLHLTFSLSLSLSFPCKPLFRRFCFFNFSMYSVLFAHGGPPVPSIVPTRSHPDPCGPPTRAKSLLY